MQVREEQELESSWVSSGGGGWGGGKSSINGASWSSPVHYSWGPDHIFYKTVCLNQLPVTLQWDCASLDLTWPPTALQINTTVRPTLSLTSTQYCKVFGVSGATLHLFSSQSDCQSFWEGQAFFGKEKILTSISGPIVLVNHQHPGQTGVMRGRQVMWSCTQIR
jgi:hypothetical protein